MTKPEQPPIPKEPEKVDITLEMALDEEFAKRHQADIEASPILSQKLEAARRILDFVDQLPYPKPNPKLRTALWARLDAIEEENDRASFKIWGFSLFSKPKYRRLILVPVAIAVILVIYVRWPIRPPILDGVAQIEQLEMIEDQELYEDLELFENLDVLDDIAVIERLPEESS